MSVISAGPRTEIQRVPMVPAPKIPHLDQPTADTEHGAFLRQIGLKLSTPSADLGMLAGMYLRFEEQFVTATTVNWQDIVPQSPIESACGPAERGAIRQKNRDAIALLSAWMSDDSGYDERVWPLVKSAIESNRSSDRRPFGKQTSDA